MKRNRIRLLAILLAAVLFPGACLAQPALSLPGSTAAWLDTGDDMGCGVSLQVKSLLPYGTETVDQMNALLKHIIMDIDVAADGSSTELVLCVDGKPVTNVKESEVDGVSAITTPLLPKRLLTASTSAADALLAGEESDAFDLFAAVSEAENCYAALGEAVVQLAPGKKANYKIKNVGTGKWSSVAKLNKEQAAELAPLMITVLSCGLSEADRAVIASLTFKKDFTVALYKTAEDGEDIAVYMKGNVTTADGASKTLNYLWAFTRGESKQVDTYKLELGKNRRGAIEIKADCTQSDSGSDRSLKGSSECVHRTEEGAFTDSIDWKLSGKLVSGKRTVSGTVTLKQKQGKDTVQTQYTADLTSSGSRVSGTVDVAETVGKNEVTAVTLLFGDKAMPDAASEDAEEKETAGFELYIMSGNGGKELLSSSSSLMQNAEEPTPADDEQSAYQVTEAPAMMTSYTVPDAEITVSLDIITPAEKQQLISEAAQRLAGKLLIALGSLPAQDTALLRNNISEENYAAFLEMLSDF